MSEQQREEKQSRASSFSHKAPAQAAASAKGMPSAANALRAISAISSRIRYTLARMPSDPILHTLSYLRAKPLCLKAARLESASRQALEELAPRLLQIPLHAESSTLLFYQEKRG